MTAALHGWHDGEIIVQQKLGYREAVAQAWRVTESSMREQHRIFHTSNLHFVPLTTSDGDGRPWASLLAGSRGEIGFIKSPDSNTLLVQARLWEGDPLLETLRAWLDPDTRRAAHAERFLIAGVGIEFSTRRRNKFAGYIRWVRQITEMDFELTLFINEAHLGMY
ncbi:hypothetical protein NQ176_g6312 [Zarea fungicola]|uniref:Uncharacterized protein n=1 Tax=Zarea fungicola TaxID=93591 RepID=A0ACC1N3U7_9HYPO|nr:hypothetical protein NQ176_g6312 [Lecanicillium fungicola]